VDEGAGVDAGDGGSWATAVKYFDEIRRRVGGRIDSTNEVVRVFLRGANGVLTQDIRVDFSIGQHNVLTDPPLVGVDALWIIAETLPAVYTGTVTGYQAWDSAAGHEVQITDSALPVSWTDSGLVGGLLVFDDGDAQNGGHFVAVDLGGKTARFSKLFVNDTWGGYPAEAKVGDAFKVVPLLELRGSLSIDTGGRVWVDNLWLHPVDYNGLDVYNSIVAFSLCRVDHPHVTIWGSGYTTFSGCMFDHGGNEDLLAGWTELWWSVLVNTGLTAHPGATLRVKGESLVTHNSTMVAHSGGYVLVAAELGCVDNTAPVLYVRPGGAAEVREQVFGYECTGAYTMVVEPAGCLAFDGVHTPTATGASTAAVAVGGVGKTWAEAAAGYVNQLNLACTVQSGDQVVLPTVETGSVLTVANTAALTLLDDQAFDNGTPFWCASLLDFFSLERESTVAVAPAMVVATRSGTGRFHRRCAPNQYWVDLWDAQGLHINGVTGNDENPGTEALPLKSDAERGRRMGGLLFHGNVADGRMNVYLHSTLNEDIFVNTVGGIPSNFPVNINPAIIYRGERSATVHTGTLTAGTVPFVEGSVRGVLEDTTLDADGWTPYVGRSIRLTSGAHTGAVVWIMGTVAGNNKRAYYQQGFNLDTWEGNIDPASGDGYEVFDQTVINGRVRVKSTETIVWLLDIHVNSSAHEYMSVGTGSVVFAANCRFGTSEFQVRIDGQLDFYNCSLEQTQRSDVLGTCYIDGCALRGVLQPYNGGTVWVYANSVCMPNSGGANTGPQVDFLGALYVMDGCWLGLFDQVAATPAMRVFMGGSVHADAAVWGIDNTCSTGVDVAAGGSYYYTAGHKPSIENPTSDVTIAGVAKTYGELPFANNDLNARIVQV
jgi:hypothetical protein